MQTVEVVDAVESRSRREVINNDPYCDVRLARIYDTAGRGTDKFMVELMSPEQEWLPIPGTKSVHSAGYNLVPNSQVRDMAHDVMEATGIDFVPVPGFGESSTSMGTVWNGKHYLERWFSRDVRIKSPSGSDVMLGLEVRNSYDKSCAVGLAFFAMHMACANQFHSRQLFGQPFTFRHVDSGGNIGDSFQDSLDEINNKAQTFGSIIPHLELLSNTRFDTMDEFLDLRGRMMDTAKVEFRDRQILDELSGRGITHKIGLDVGDAYGGNNSYWSLANAYSAVTTHMVGGMRGQDLSQRAIDFLLKDAKSR